MSENEPQLTKEQIAVFKEAFAKVDKKGKGKGEITLKQLGLVLKSLGMQLTEPELMDLINEVDKDGNGKIDLKEYLDMMNRKMREVEAIKKDSEGILKETFKAFDKRRDGHISAPELRLVMQNLGENVSKEDVEAMINWAEKDKNGQISYEEFKKIVKKVGADKDK